MNRNSSSKTAKGLRRQLSGIGSDVMGRVGLWRVTGRANHHRTNFVQSELYANGPIPHVWDAASLAEARLVRLGSVPEFLD